MYEPYVTMPEEYREPLTAAARNAGYTTNAAYIRARLIASIVRDCPEADLPDSTEPVEGVSRP
jgi:hypothetical protein